MDNSNKFSVYRETAQDHLSSANKICAAILQSTYILAKVAQGKLLRECSKADPDLRRIVIHTNFVNSLAMHHSIGRLDAN